MGNHKIFVFGLDRAGKTVITTYLSKGVVDNNTKPSLSFNQSMLILPKLKIAVWDTPGQIKLRKLWIDKVANSEILIFVLDTSDVARYEEAKTELTNFIKGLYNFKAPIIFLFHKLDLPFSKESLPRAKAFFDLDNIFIQKVIPMETNKDDIKTLEALREKINDLLIKIEVENAKVMVERKERAEELKKSE